MIQRTFHVIGHKKDDHQWTDCSKQCRQNSDKSTPIVVIAIMINHHNNSIDHNTQRDSNTRQRNQVKLNIKQVIKNNGYQHVGK